MYEPVTELRVLFNGFSGVFLESWFRVKNGSLIFCRTVIQGSIYTTLSVISSGAQYVTLKQYFFTSQFSCSLFSNPIHKTETETRQQTGGRLQIKPPGPIIFRNTEQESDHIYYTLFFSAGAQRRCALYKPPQTVHIYGAKTIS